MESPLPRSLKKCWKKRFPNKGLDCPLRRAADYLDPKHKGLHLIESVQEETKRELEDDWKKVGTEDNNMMEELVPTVENNPLLTKAL